MTSKVPPWYRFQPDTWAIETRNLEPYVAVALLTIRGESHLRGGAVPEDPRILAYRCNMTRQAMRKAIDHLVGEGLLRRVSGGLVSDYILDEISYREERLKKAGKNAGKRWGKDEQYQQNGDAREDASKAAGPMLRERATPLTSREDDGPKDRHHPQSSSSTFDHAPRSTFDGSSKGDARASLASPAPRSDVVFNHEPPWSQGDDGPEEYDGPEDDDDIERFGE
ncbi:YdaU family protein [Mesorhizobium sp. M0615]|uniref:hypothetical protein n=1 Tax=Mesorhizobium sp. M0615 TaxID=2956971 RepID=UPI00333974F4